MALTNNNNKATTCSSISNLNNAQLCLFQANEINISISSNHDCTKQPKNDQLINDKPRPLVRELSCIDEFPINALGDILGGAAQAIADIVQCPSDIAGQSVISAASLATQHLRNVEIDGREYPISLFCLTVAESGQRKSAADKLALKSHGDYQKQELLEYESKKIEYANAMLSYETARERIKKDKPSSTEAMQDALNDLKAPQRLIAPHFLMQEPTFEGLFKAFEFGRSSQGLFNDEAGQVFGGHAMSADNMQKTITGMSKIWDGCEITRTRASEMGSTSIYGSRLAIHLMLQPVIANKIFASSLLLEQGFLPRFLIALPETNAGTRLYKHRDPQSDTSLYLYWNRIKVLLSIPSQNEKDIFPKIGLSPAAKSQWIKEYNKIEINQRKHGELVNIKSFASKAAENILRVAAILTLVENEANTEIDERHIKNASIIMLYYLNQIQKCLANGKIDDILDRAQILLNWLQSKHHKEFVSKRDICRNAPRGSGARKSVNEAQKLIDTLIHYGWLHALPTNSIIDGKLSKEGFRLVNEH
tara:strand:- start:15016 stop:16617 length:1602 start_codon:yes stop_codon:yes gene_type:complete